jgi:CheY-like chemotaxis protein/two-component sensor histidine kinase
MPSSLLEERRIERAEVVAKLAGSVVHNFNNILSVVTARVQMLLAQLEAGAADPDTLRIGLLSIQKAGRDASELLIRLRDLTRTPEELTVSVFDLNRVVQDAVEFIRPHVATVSQTQGIRLRVTARLAETPLLISGQPSAIREVVVNLTLNAVEAMPAGGEITVQTTRTAGEVELSVSDTGVGMSDEVRSRLFTPFFTTKGPGNTGLGLSSARELVEKHGGRIAVTSAPGRGTTFTVALPSAEARESPSGPGNPGARIPAGLRVLVVEDEPDFAEILRELLAGAGCAVTVVHSGGAGLAAVERDEPYDLVLTDVLLPEVSGWEIARAAKRRSPPTAVVVTSGHLIAEELRAGPAPVDAALTKPIDLGELERVVAELARRRPSG